jgi:hypothetical protein
MTAQHRIEIIEQHSGWWVGEIWNADNKMVYRAHARSKEDAQRQTETELDKFFNSSIKPEVTITHLRTNQDAQPTQR